MRFSYCILVVFLIQSNIVRSQEIRFYAESDAKEVVAGGYVVVKFILENEEGRNFQPPDFANLRILSGPNRSSQMSIVNGVVSREMSISYNLLVSQEGTVKIGSASIIAKGKKYVTEPLEIKVVAGKDISSLTNEEEAQLFVKMDVSDTSGYIGQQITLKYVLYTTQNVHSYDFISESPYDGFFVKRIRNFNDRTERVVLNGIQYTRKPLKTIALFPQQTGKFEIEPANINLGIPERGAQNNFFFTTRVRNTRRISNPVSISVFTAPPNPPLSYSGAIGKYTMNASIDRQSVTTEDAVTLTMNVFGNGDGKFVGPPKQSFSGDFEIYDPNVILDNTFERGDLIRVEKRFEYLIVPIRSGRYLISPEFSYFDTDSNKFITLSAGPFQIRVANGQGARDIAELKKNSEAELMPISQTAKFRKKDQHFLFSRTYWGLLSIPFLVLLGTIMYKYQQYRKSQIDPIYLKQQAARKIAGSKLNEAKTLKEEQNKVGFYQSLRDSLYGYVADKLLIAKADLNKENIFGYLGNENIPQNLIEEFLQLINTCEMALYAGGSAETLDDDYNLALKIITDIESRIK